MRLTVQGNEIFYLWLEKKSNEIQEKLINQQVVDNDDMFVLTIKAQTDRFHNMIIKFREEFQKSEKRFKQADKRFEQMYQQSGKRFERWQESFDKRTEQSDIRFDFEKKVLICVGALIITLLIGICLK